MFTNVTLPYMSHSKLFIVNKAHGMMGCPQSVTGGPSVILEFVWEK